MALAPGDTFERYTIEKLIGRGGMGEVYAAMDTRLRRKVALKVIRPEQAEREDAVARLHREARAAASLSHPNSVAIHDLGDADGTFYIVMELVVGTSLRELAADRSISPARRVRWLVGIARALAAAHRVGVVHRDVKPSNVIITDDDVVKVLDFGLAKPFRSNAPMSFATEIGRVVGTPRYMAPEQIAGMDADERSDQFSFGLTAHELLSGVLSPGPVEDSHRPLDAARDGVPPSVAEAIARTLARDPADRFESMTDVAVALDTALEAGLVGRGRNAPGSEVPTSPEGEQEDGPPAAPTSDAVSTITVPPVTEPMAGPPVVVTGRPATLLSADLAAVMGGAALPAVSSSVGGLDATLPVGGAIVAPSPSGRRNVPLDEAVRLAAAALPDSSPTVEGQKTQAMPVAPSDPQPKPVRQSEPPVASFRPLPRGASRLTIAVGAVVVLLLGVAAVVVALARR